MQNAHLDALSSKHASLDQRIAEESLHPSSDTTVLAQLKKEKLRLKDEITNHLPH